MSLSNVFVVLSSGLLIAMCKSQVIQYGAKYATTHSKAGTNYFMSSNRFWVGIVALCSIVAFAMALAIATVGTAVFASGETPSPALVAEHPSAPAQVAEDSTIHAQSYEGVVTDSRCGAKHQSSFGKTASDCTRVCVHGGSQFALVDGDKTFLLEGDPALLKKAAGTRVTITGMLKGNTITVSSVASGM